MVPLVVAGCQLASRDDLEKTQDPLRRKLAERVFDQMHFEVGVPSFVNRMLVTPPQRISTQSEPLPDGRRRTRGTIHTPRGELTFVNDWDLQAGTTWHVKYPVETYEDIEKIASVPWERPPDLRPPELDSLPPDFPERGIVRTGISSPFVCVAGMMPYERFLELCATDLPLLKELTEVCRERILDCLRVLFSRPGIEYVWIGGSEWVTPPMAEAKALAAGRIALGGNIEARVLCNEDEATTEAATRAAFEGGKERFVLRPTDGPSPRMSEREFRNYMRMIDVWEELSAL